MNTCTKRQSLTIYSSIKKEKKREIEKKRLLKLLSTLCGDKGVNFLENFLTKKMFWYCLCTVSFRDSHAKKSKHDKQWNFCVRVLMKSLGIKNTESNQKC